MNFHKLFIFAFHICNLIFLLIVGAICDGLDVSEVAVQWVRESSRFPYAFLTAWNVVSWIFLHLNIVSIIACTHFFY